MFMVTKVSDPLLCITVSTTLRSKPLAVTPPRKALAALIDTVGGLKSELISSPVKENGVDHDSTHSDDDEILSGLQEVNLLEGLATGCISYFLPSCRGCSRVVQDRLSLILTNDSPCPQPV